MTFLAAADGWPLHGALRWRKRRLVRGEHQLGLAVRRPLSSDASEGGLYMQAMLALAFASTTVLRGAASWKSTSHVHGHAGKSSTRSCSKHASSRAANGARVELLRAAIGRVKIVRAKAANLRPIFSCKRGGAQLSRRGGRRVRI